MLRIRGNPRRALESLSRLRGECRQGATRANPGEGAREPLSGERERRRAGGGAESLSPAPRASPGREGDEIPGEREESGREALNAPGAGELENERGSPEGASFERERERG